MIEISEIHYTCVTKIAKVIPDTGNGDVSSNALMQSVLYSIMDYMDVYTFGETTANMIAEVGYTQAMTITSTAITAPLLALGAWATLSTQEVQKQVTAAVVNTVQETAVKQASQEIAKLTWGQTISKLLGSKTLTGLLTQVAIKTVSGVVAETVEEIVIDGLVETYFQSLVTSMGGSADLGHWVSTLMTTARETKFFSSFFSTGGQTSQAERLSQDLVTIDHTISDMNQNQEQMIPQQIYEQHASINSELDAVKQEATLSLKKLLKAGLLVGLSLIMPSMAGFNLYAITKTLRGTNNQAYTSSVIKPQIQGLAMRNVMVSGEALSNFEYVKIDSLFGEKPVISGEYSDMNSLFEQPSTEVISEISDLASVLNGLETSGIEYNILNRIFEKNPSQRSAIESNILEYSIAAMGGPSDPDGIKQVDNMKEKLMKDLENEIEDAETKATELQETEVPKTQVDPLKDLKGYNNIVKKLMEENPNNPVIEKLIELSQNRVREIAFEWRNNQQKVDKISKQPSKNVQKTLYDYIPNQDRIIKMADFGEINFKRVITNPEKFGVNCYVYQWNWIGDPSQMISNEHTSLPLSDLPYTGYTGNFDERKMKEVFDTLEKIITNNQLTYFENAISICLKKESENIIRYLNDVDKEADLRPLLDENQNLDNLQNWLNSRTVDPSDKARVKKFILSKSVVQKYFKIQQIEAHSSTDKALQNEEGITLNYQHKVQGRSVSGTVWPNGLNMKAGGSGVQTGAKNIATKYIFDIIALASLGLLEKSSAEILNTFTSKEITHQTISGVISSDTGFANYMELQEYAFRSVLWGLISEKVSQGGYEFFTKKDLTDSLPFKWQYIDTRLKNWFGADLNTLHKYIKAGCIDIDKIKDVVAQDLIEFRGNSIEDIKMWLMDASLTNQDLAVKFGYSTEGLSKQFRSYLKEKVSPLLANGQKLSATDLAHYLRAEEMKRQLSAGVAPEILLSQCFHVKSWVINNKNELVVKKDIARSFFERTFEGIGEVLTFEDIMLRHSTIADTIIEQYERGKRNPILYNGPLFD